MDLFDLDQDRDQWRTVVNTVMNLRVSQNTEELLSSCSTGGLSSRAKLYEDNF
jgi:hypothetical protein